MGTFIEISQASRPVDESVKAVDDVSVLELEPEDPVPFARRRRASEITERPQVLLKSGSKLNSAAL